ncbi:MAG TPA: hypothetical protein VGP26_27330 [Actinophytocola sp.]|jgi:hypothetical protein|nr:hypothetical protein [Actinophytocola sp.]
MSAMGVPLFDAVLCDLDGVLRRWPPVHDQDLPPGTVAAAAFAPGPAAGGDHRGAAPTRSGAPPRPTPRRPGRWA